MKCKHCDGVGFFGNGASQFKCVYCDGTGEVEQTNEEWFDALTTEKKAKIIKMVINICISCKEYKTVRTRGCLLRQNMAKGLVFLPCMDEDGICEWLKQPHTTIKE